MTEEELCFALHNPEQAKAKRGSVCTYLLTERVPLELSSMAHVTNAITAAKLGIAPPRIEWFDLAPTGDYAQMKLDELPVFQHAPLRGIALGRVKMIAINARQRSSDLVETVAHETFHIARGDRGEAAALAHGEWMRRLLCETGLIDTLVHPDAER